MINTIDFDNFMSLLSTKRMFAFFKKKLISLKDISVFEVATVSIIIISVLYFKINGKTSSESVDIQIKLSRPDSYYSQNYFEPPEWVYNSINVGDGWYDFSGKKKVEVMSKDWFETTLEQSSGAHTKSKGNGFLNINVTANCSKSTKICNFNGQNLIVGNSIELDLENTKVFGTIFRTDNSLNHVIKDVVLKASVSRGLPSELVSSIPSEEEIFDERGEFRYSVLSKKSSYYKFTAIRSDGKAVVAYDPLESDVELILKLRVKEYDGELYFNEEQKIKIAENLFIQFDDININWLKIIEIMSVEDVKIQ